MTLNCMQIMFKTDFIMVCSVAISVGFSGESPIINGGHLGVTESKELN